MTLPDQADSIPRLVSLTANTYHPMLLDVRAILKKIGSDGAAAPGYTGSECPNNTPVHPQMTIDPNKKYTATFNTSRGEIVCELFAKDAPKTVNNFVFLARDKFYDGTKFHRVIANFMIQGGDPEGTGRGGPGYRFEDEIQGRKNNHKVGIALHGQCRTEHQRQPVLHHPRRHRIPGSEAHRLRPGAQRAGRGRRRASRATRSPASRLPKHNLLQTSRMKILAVGAHPDDVEFGCAPVLIQEVRNGHEVRILVTSKGEAASAGTSGGARAGSSRGRPSYRRSDPVSGTGRRLPHRAQPGNGDRCWRWRSGASARMWSWRRTWAKISIRIIAAVGKSVRDAARLARYGGLQDLEELPPHPITSLYYYAITQVLIGSAGAGGGRERGREASGKPPSCAIRAR